MFIMLTIGIFLLKFLALAVIGLFFVEDLELIKSVGGSTYTAYMGLAILTFASLLFFVLGKKLLWLILFLGFGASYLGMYNEAPGIKEIHQSNDLKSRYFQDGTTFIARMGDVWRIISQDKQ